jgi:hypothetical protein
MRTSDRFDLNMVRVQVSAEGCSGVGESQSRNLPSVAGESHAEKSVPSNMVTSGDSGTSMVAANN